MSGRVRPLEVKALVPLLEQNWETPEELAEEMVRTLDSVRADKTSYVAVMEFSSRGTVWYSGIGPFAGEASAKRAVSRHPGATLAHHIAVVPMMSPEGLEAHLEKVG